MSDPHWTRPFPPGHHLHFSPLRRIQEHSDSEGNKYNILVQTEEMSCGVAAAVMAVDLYNQSAAPGGPELEARYKKIAGQFKGSLLESDKLWAQGKKEFGSTVDNISSLLKKIGVSNDTSYRKDSTGGPLLKAYKFQLRKPALVLFGWYPNGVTSPSTGGHFAVAAITTKTGHVVILDPWDGSLTEFTPGTTYRSIGIADWIIHTK